MMTEAELAFVATVAFLSLFILLSGLVGLMASRSFADGTRGPFRVIYGALAAGGLAFFLVLGAQIELHNRSVDRVVRSEMHGHGSFRP